MTDMPFEVGKHEAQVAGQQKQWEDLTVPVARHNVLFEENALEVAVFTGSAFTAAEIAEATGPHANQNRGRVKKNLDLLASMGVLEKSAVKRDTPDGGRPATLFKKTDKFEDFLDQNPAISRRVRIRVIAEALGKDDIEAFEYIIALGERAVLRQGLLSRRPK